MKTSLPACYCFVDREPCTHYAADPERQCVCTECGHTAACHPSKAWTDGEGDQPSLATCATRGDAAAAGP